MILSSAIAIVKKNDSKSNNKRYSKDSGASFTS